MSAMSNEMRKETKYFDVKDHPNVDYESLDDFGKEVLKDGVRPLTMKRVRALSKHSLHGFLIKNKVLVDSFQNAKKSKLAHISIALIRAVEGLNKPKVPIKAKKTPAKFNNSRATRTVCLSAERKEEMAKLRLELENVTEVRRDEAPPQCVVCLDKDVEYAFDGCGHAGVCDDCRQALTNVKSNKCPVCRKPFTQYTKLYLT